MKRLLIILFAVTALAGCQTRTYIVNPVEGDATAAIQEKLDRCFLGGGGMVMLKAGDYHVGGLRLRSCTTLYLKRGAHLIGSRDCSDYRIMSGDALEPLDAEDMCGDDLVYVPPYLRKEGKAPHIMTAGSRWNDAMIRIYKAHDVAIIGEKGSSIDGCNSYDPQGEESYRGVHGISAHKSEHLLFKGYQIENTGNWAHLLRNCTGARFENLTILAGHDGVHFSTCDSVTVTNCLMETGDDCIAGFDNRHVLVQGCTLNSSCSAFRIGGTDFHVSDCDCWGPGEYDFRGSLSIEEKISGAMTGAKGRRNMLALFTYYADRTIDVREKPGDIRFSDIRCHDVDRLIHYNLSGNETWQSAVPLGEVTFERVSAQNLRYAVCVYSSPECPFTLNMSDCTLDFGTDAANGGETPVAECFRGAWIERMNVSGLKACGLAEGAPLLRYWGGMAPEMNVSDITGTGTEVAAATEPFHVKGI